MVRKEDTALSLSGRTLADDVRPQVPSSAPETENTNHIVVLPQTEVSIRVHMPKVRWWF